MTIIVDNYIIPEQGQIELKINHCFEIRVTAKQARRQVNRWVHDEVSYLMRGLPPTLVVGEQQIVWRVPISFGVPQIGQAGIIGNIEVDVYTGELNHNSGIKQRLLYQAERLATQLPAYKPRQELRPEFLADSSLIKEAMV